MSVATRPRVRADLCVVELDGERVVFDEADGSLHHLNATASLVFVLCDGTATVHELAVDVSDAFGVPLDEVTTEVGALVDQLRRANLLEPA